MTHRIVSEYTPIDLSNTNIKVYVRARPPDDGIENNFITFSSDDETKVTIKDPGGESKKKYGEVSFQVDRILWTKSDQDEVFNTICKPQVEHVLHGYNSCCFAYGQTGSGKTYSMFGEAHDLRGMIPRSVEYIFECLQSKSTTHEVAMVASFLEIYNDQIRDLGKAYLVAMGVEASTSSALYDKTTDIFESIAGKRGNPYFAPAFHKGGADSTQMTRPGLKEVQDEYQTMNFDIREDADGNVFVKDLSLVPVTNADEVLTLINMGLKVRATHETKMNATSSRSHTVFALTVIQRNRSTGEAISGVLNLVDLAGSERLKKSESQGIRLKEALHINTSLTALGKVIMALDPSSDKTHVPFRDSKLTRVLQNSLGGNSFTVVLAAIHPRPDYYEECLSTLQFANRCRNVRNNPRVNYMNDNEDKDKRIRQLMDELNALRSRLNGNGSGGHGNVHRSGADVGALILWLKKAGIEAEVGADGNPIVNGKVLNIDELGLGEGSVDLSVASDEGTNENRPSRGQHMSSTHHANGGSTSAHGSARSKKALAELQEASRIQQMKNKEIKVQMEEQGRQLQELANELTKAQTTIKHKEYEYKSLQEEGVRLLRDQAATLNTKHATEIREIVSHNSDVIKQQKTTIQNAPESFKVYSTLIKKATESKVEFETPLREEFERHLLVLEKSKVEETKIVKLQYEHWLLEKDKSLEEFVEKFNSYRHKKSEQLRMCEKEIVKMYSYTEKLEEILDGVEHGKYRVQQRQGKSGKTTTGLIGSMSANGRTNSNNNTGGNGEMIEEMGAVVLPKGLRPTNPVKVGDVDLSLTKRIVGRHKQREEKLEKIKEEAFHRSLAHAARSGAATMGPVDPILEQQVRDLLIAPREVSESSMRGRGNNDNPLDSSSAPASAGGMGEIPGDKPSSASSSLFTNAHDQLLHDDTMNNSSLMDDKDIIIGSITGSGTGSGLSATAPSRIQFNLPNHHNSANITADELKALQNELHRLKNLKMQEDISFQKISEQLSSNETLNYIKHLENEMEKQHKQIRDLSQQIQNYKTSHASLSRQIDKMSAYHNGSGNGNTADNITRYGH